MLDHRFFLSSVSFPRPLYISRPCGVRFYLLNHRWFVFFSVIYVQLLATNPFLVLNPVCSSRLRCAIYLPCLAGYSCCSALRDSSLLIPYLHDWNALLIRVCVCCQSHACTNERRSFVKRSGRGRQRKCVKRNVVFRLNFLAAKVKYTFTCSFDRKPVFKKGEGNIVTRRQRRRRRKVSGKEKHEEGLEHGESEQCGRQLLITLANED